MAQAYREGKQNLPLAWLAKQLISRMAAPAVTSQGALLCTRRAVRRDAAQRTQHEEGHQVHRILCRVLGLARPRQRHNLQLALQAVGDDCGQRGGRPVWVSVCGGWVGVGVGSVGSAAA